MFRKVDVDEQGNELHTDAEVLLRGVAVRSDNRILPKETQDVSFFFPYNGSLDFVVETKLHYRYPVALEKPEAITFEKVSASRSAQ